MKKIEFCSFLLLILVFNSCQEIEEDGTIIQEGEPIVLGISQSTEFSIFEIVTIDLGEGTFSDGQQEGTTLEGEKIPLIIQENTLTFMVPKLNQGEYKLVFSENNKPFNIPFKVKPHDLKESPEVVLANYKKESEEQIVALERTKELLQGESKESLGKDIETLRSFTAAKLAEVASLTSAEQTDMAFFLQANESWINEVTQAVNGFTAIASNARLINSKVKNDIVNIEERSEQIMKEFLEAKTRVTKNIPLIVGVFTLGTLKGGIPGGLAASGLVIATLSRNFIRLLGSIDSIFEFIRMVEDDEFSINNRASYLFTNRTPTEVLVNREYRTLYRGDADSSIPLVKDFVLGFSELLQSWNELVEKVSLDLSFQANDFTQQTEYKTQSFVVHSNHLSISGITNNKVTGSATKENGKLLLTFNTAETDAQEFDFKLTYNHAAFGQHEKTLDAAVVNEGCNLTMELKDKNKVTATATGYGPFTFIYPAGQMDGEKSVEILASSFGEMVVKIKDQNDCESEAKIDIPCTLEIDVLNTDNTYTIEALDGLPPFSYNWSNGATSKTQTLPPGNHTVTVSDALGCKIEHTISINCDLEVNIQKDGNNVTAQATGGTPPLTFTWSNGATGASQNNLNPGTYVVTVKDLIGCSDSNSINIVEEIPIDSTEIYKQNLVGKITATNLQSKQSFELNLNMDGTGFYMVPPSPSKFGFRWSIRKNEKGYFYEDTMWNFSWSIIDPLSFPVKSFTGYYYDYAQRIYRKDMPAMTYTK